MLNKFFLITLLNLPNIGRKTAWSIIRNTNYKPDTTSDLLCLIEDAKQVNKRIVVPSHEDLDNATAEAERTISESKNQGIEVLTCDDSNFPKRLNNIPDPPILLYVRGNLQILNEEKAIAIVGTREPSEYGLKCGRAISKHFTEKGFIIVSGLAKGCDTIAHLGCLDGNGKTIAILGHGLHTIYPAENKKLAEDILEKDGCLLSEYPVGTNSRPNYFIERDRLQSGLSSALFVIETGIKGGTMHAVNSAFSENKPIACLQHPEQYKKTPKAEGNNYLILEKNAYPIADKDDIDKFISSCLIQSHKDNNKLENSSCPKGQLRLW